MSKINLEIGALPVFDWVAVELIDVDSNYQRELDGRKVEKILSEFRWDHFGALTLARKAGDRFSVTDGQHRAKAASLHPLIDRVPAMIIAGAGLQAEAENFLVINRDRKVVSSIERYWAGLASGDPVASRIRSVLQSAGCDVAPDQGTYKPNLTNSVTAIGRALERYGDKAVRHSLETIRAAWPSESKALRGTLIAALSRVIEGNIDGINMDRLVSILKPKSFEDLTASAESLRKLAGGDAPTMLARTITEIYNRGLSANQIYFGERKS
ncbi:DUF6551 family protein [Agrobacterium vitis]|uniref:ParB/Sulfiredoxin domain-containing protein n=1 Tax=Agrobacterium vitis TaxID=373 RepID=A0A7K1RD94_AGRVI|nr:DUF6551 family protein [Agrobacterium vitis]MVA55972.1 hypothetical protein [Agrobacterium vitis]